MRSGLPWLAWCTPRWAEPKKAYSAAALFGETNFGRKAAKFGRAQNQRPKIRHGVEPSCALWPPPEARSPWSHATCYMWCNAWANRGQPMGHGYGAYELFWRIVSDTMTCETHTNSKNSYVGGFVWELPIVSTLRTGKSTMFTSTYVLGTCEFF